MCPSFYPPLPYSKHDSDSWATKERIASVAQQKIDFLFSQKKREPSLRFVLLHTTLLERIRTEIDLPLRETDETRTIDENIRSVEKLCYYEQVQLNARSEPFIIYVECPPIYVPAVSPSPILARKCWDWVEDDFQSAGRSLNDKESSFQWAITMLGK